MNNEPLKSVQHREVEWSTWTEQHESLYAWRDAQPGRQLSVVLKPEHATYASQFDHLRSVDRIVVNIDQFTDGRIFGIGRHLRQYVDFRGVLEARGDYLPDQVAFLTRCGFEQFSRLSESDEVPPGFSAHYQSLDFSTASKTSIRFAREVSHLESE